MMSGDGRGGLRDRTCDTDTPLLCNFRPTPYPQGTIVV
ncbi:hypothetical protein AVDCRST_MAG94-5337 [uncultured Leptolyngbya sp.]|uniref:Uncharacterized protein n=1 Tax=uncultured Leptolyngbya sp. TaxID=332963 RepID=A0A6J4NM42_9CYAN|nr:hypothetical protein AVDCRST_MAG94-5337 [uncultured Leptolyngbya sp.]